MSGQGVCVLQCQGVCVLQLDFLWGLNRESTVTDQIR